MQLEGRELLSTLTVGNTNDSGPGSLRAAVVQANSDGGGDAIVFSSSVFNTPQKITLTSGPIALTGAAMTTITGPGTNMLSISGDNASRVFDIASGSAAELSGLTVTDGKANHGGGIRNDGGTLALDQIVLRDNRARVGGGLYNNGSAALNDVTFHGNIARKGSRFFSTRKATLTENGLSSPKATGTIVNQTFNGTVVPPANWTVFLPGKVAQSPTTFLTMTDTSKNGAGILSSLSNVPFKLGGTTKITAIISKIGVNPVGNAIVGLLGPNNTAQSGELAAGIDSTGKVFIVYYDPAQNLQQPSVVQVKTLSGYTGGKVTMTVTIDSGGIQITAVTGNTTTNFRKFTFANDLKKFSLKTAFPVGAIPALVAASQPGQAGGSASFESINVSTA
jgi:hypothetical protein